MVFIIFVSVSLFAADWICKQNISPRLLCQGWIRIALVKNTGLLLGKGKSHPLLVRWLPAGVLLFLLLFFPSLGTAALPARFGYGLLLGGGANNLADRIFHGYVTDFINFPRIKRLRNLYFNLSDFGIFLGMILFLLFF